MTDRRGFEYGPRVAWFLGTGITDTGC